jgi:hypothetical protein
MESRAEDEQHEQRDGGGRGEEQVVGVGEQQLRALRGRDFEAISGCGKYTGMGEVWNGAWPAYGIQGIRRRK